MDFRSHFPVRIRFLTRNSAGGTYVASAGILSGAVQDSKARCLKGTHVLLQQTRFPLHCAVTSLSGVYICDSHKVYYGIFISIGITETCPKILRSCRKNERQRSLVLRLRPGRQISAGREAAIDIENVPADKAGLSVVEQKQRRAGNLVRRCVAALRQFADPFGTHLVGLQPGPAASRAVPTRWR
jgi:hypothetical protein